MEYKLFQRPKIIKTIDSVVDGCFRTGLIKTEPTYKFREFVRKTWISCPEGKKVFNYTRLQVSNTNFHMNLNCHSSR
jgi:hypothetical protein